VVLTPPPVPVITQAGNQLTSSSPVNNQWFVNGNPIPGATGQVYIAPGPGSYTVVVTDPATGCSSESLPVLIVSVGEPAVASNLILYPNPAGDYVIFENGSQAEALVALIDMTGKTIGPAIAVPARSRRIIGTAGLPAGVYVLKSQTDGVAYKRLVKL
jgi:hypothetical protein